MTNIKPFKLAFSWFKRYQRLITWGTLVCLVTVVIITKFFNQEDPESAEKSLPHVFATQVSAAEEMIFVRASGVTTASRKINLLSETAGEVYQLHRRKGSILNARDPIATIHLDDRNQQLKEAQAAHALAKEKLKITEKLAAGNYRSEINLKTARVEYESASAKLARIEKDISNTRITAPYTGVLGDVFLEEGSVVAPGTPIASLLEMDPILVQVYVSEKNHGRFQVGSTAQLTFANSKTGTGTIKFISSIADPKTHMFLVEVSMPNPEFGIPEGVTAKVDIPTQKVSVHKVAPSVLSLDKNGNMVVKTVDIDQKVKTYPVQLVQSVGDTLWVLGLPDDTIIIDYGSHFVNEGDIVKWTPTRRLKERQND